MANELDKLVKEQQTNIEKGAGKSYSERQPYATKVGRSQDKMNDLLGASGVKTFLEFMRKYSVDPTGSGHKRDVDLGTVDVVDSQTKVKRTVAKRGQELDLDATTKSTANPAITFGEYTTDDKKICSAYFEKATDTCGKFRLIVEPISRNHSFLIYYLPWESKKILRLKIPSTPTAGKPDPDIFFTAGINGCSVFFVGDSKSPEVYHAGTEEKLGNINSGKYWRTLFREWNTTAAADPKGAKTYGEVKKSQYINALGKETDSKFDGQTKESLDYKQWLKDNQKDVDVTLVQPWGCVFGLRDANRDWTFYLQKNAVVKYYSFKKSGLFGTGARKRGASEQVVNLPMELVKVFPGRAHVRISNYFSVRQGY